VTLAAIALDQSMLNFDDTTCQWVIIENSSAEGAADLIWYAESASGTVGHRLHAGGDSVVLPISSLEMILVESDPDAGGGFATVAMPVGG
jgi:hypothetical protein